METTQNTQINLNKLPFLYFIDRAYIRLFSLDIFFKMPKYLLNDWIYANVTRVKTLYINRVYWIDIDLLYNDENFVVPSKLEIRSIYFGRSKIRMQSNDSLCYLYEQLKIKVNSYDYLLDTLKVDYSNSISQNISASISLFSYLSSLKRVTIKEKFFLFFRYFLETIDITPSFHTYSYTSFQNKFKSFNDRGIASFFHANKGNKNAEVLFNKEDQLKLKELYSNGVKISLRQITKEINMSRINSRGAKPVSVQKVSNFIKNGGEFSKMYFQRYGAEAVFNFLMHPERKQPLNPGTVYQIDGSRFNIPYKDEEGGIKFKKIVALLDVFSKKIIGYTLTKSETFSSYHTVIIYALCKTGFLPNEIISDNITALKSMEALEFKNKLSKLGVLFKPHALSNPQAKGQIENWFSLFGMNYLKKVPGYFGDGIKSMSKDGKPKIEILEKYRKIKNIYTEVQLEEIIHEQISLYNKTYNYKNSYPNNLFQENEATHAIPIDDDLMKFLVYKEVYKKFNKAIIRLQIGGKNYEYPIFKHKYELLEKYFHKEILVRYDVNDLSKIYIYRDKNAVKYDCILKLHKNFPLASAEQSKNDIDSIKIFSARRNALKKALTKTAKETAPTPIELILGKLDSKDVVKASTDDFLLNNQDADQYNLENFSYGSLLSEKGTNKLIE